MFADTAQGLPARKCINLSNFLEVPPDENWAYDFSPDHLEQIAEVGFDSIRIPARFGSYWNGDRIDPRFAHLVRDVVARAQSAGLFVILDIHHFDEFVADPSAHGEDFVAIWSAIGELFADRTGIAFELLNEPNGALTTEFLLPFYERAYEAIRRNHPDAWIIIGTDNWGGPEGLSKLPKVSDPRVIHTFHYYSPFQFTHQQAEWAQDPPFPESGWGDPTEKAQVSQDISNAANHHTQTFLGEFGVIAQAPPKDRVEWIRTVRQVAESHGIGWCHWGFGAVFGLYDVEKQNWDKDILFALGLR